MLEYLVFYQTHIIYHFRNCIERYDVITEKEFSALRLIDKLIDKNHYSHKVQTKILDFFEK